MIQHRIVTIFAPIVLIVLAAGCAAQSTDDRSSLSDPAAAIATNQLSGTWRGSFWQVGGWSSHIEGDVTLEIKDDATYRLISGRGTAANDSGVVVATGRGVTLKSSSGQSTQLMRKGDVLHGMATLSGRPIAIKLEKTR